MSLGSPVRVSGHSQRPGNKWSPAHCGPTGSAVATSPDVKCVIGTDGLGSWSDLHADPWTDCGLGILRVTFEMSPSPGAKVRNPKYHIPGHEVEISATIKEKDSFLQSWIGPSLLEHMKGSG